MSGVSTGYETISFVVANKSDGFGDISWALNAMVRIHAFSLCHKRPIHINIVFNNLENLTSTISGLEDFITKFYGCTYKEMVMRTMLQYEFPINEALIQTIPKPNVIDATAVTELERVIVCPAAKIPENLSQSKLISLVIAGEYSHAIEISRIYHIAKSNYPTASLVYSGPGLAENGILPPLPYGPTDIVPSNGITLLLYTFKHSGAEFVGLLTNIFAQLNNNNLTLFAAGLNNKGTEESLKLEQSITQAKANSGYTGEVTIIPDMISNPKFNYLVQHCSAVVCTGDQSLASCLFLRSGRSFYYEVRGHKTELASKTLALLSQIETEALKGSFEPMTVPADLVVKDLTHTLYGQVMREKTILDAVICKDISCWLDVTDAESVIQTIGINFNPFAENQFISIEMERRLLANPEIISNDILQPFGNDAIDGDISQGEEDNDFVFFDTNIIVLLRNLRQVASKNLGEIYHAETGAVRTKEDFKSPEGIEYSKYITINDFNKIVIKIREGVNEKLNEIQHTVASSSMREQYSNAVGILNGLLAQLNEFIPPSESQSKRRRSTFHG